MLRSPEKRIFTALALAGGLSLVYASDSQAALYSINQTGAELASNPDATFTRSPTVSGSSLVFGTGSSSQALATINLVDADVLAAADEFNVTASVFFNKTGSFPAYTSAIFAVTDGSRYYGGQLIDSLSSGNPNGNYLGKVGNPTSLSGFDFASGSGSGANFNLADSNPLVLELEVGTDLNGRTTVAFRLVSTLTGTGTLVSSSTLTDLDPSNGLQLVFGSQSFDSTYAVQSLAVELVPEPFTGTLLLGTFGLLMMRRRAA